MTPIVRCLTVVLLILSGFTTGNAAAQAPAASPDPLAVLGAAKSASGGSAWNAFRSQHSKVTLTAGSLRGDVERWSDLRNGRSYLKYALGPISGAMGYDGTVSWSQDQSGQARVEAATAAQELAVNAAYRDKLAFWFPDRGRAALRYKARENADGAEFDVIEITPDGGRPFELWVNTQTSLIERLVERESADTRTETYMDFRDVQGVKIPFRVRASRGDPRYDEVVAIDAIEFDVPLTGVQFAQPAPPAPDFAFPAGKASIDVPFEVHNGHIYVRVKLNGKGPYTMLFDSGGVNVLFPSTVKALGLKPEGALPGAGVGDAKQDVGLVKVAKLDIGGIVVDDQLFATLALDEALQRIEGQDQIAGLVGYELFKRFPVRIDYERSTLVFYEPTAFKYAGGGVRLPFRFHGHVPQVEGSVDGIAGSFDIDTGARTSLTLAAPFVDRNALTTKYGAATELIAGAGVGGPSRALLARATTLRLGDIEIAKPVTFLSVAKAGAFADPALAGNVGYGVLRQFNIVFDYSNSVLWFERNANHGQPDAYDRAGLWVERGPKGYELVEVVKAGPAADAGLKSGDVVTSVDGKPVAAVPLDQFRARLKSAPGTKVRVTLATGKTAVITLRDLI